MLRVLFLAEVGGRERVADNQVNKESRNEQRNFLQLGLRRLTHGQFFHSLKAQVRM